MPLVAALQHPLLAGCSKRPSEIEDGGGYLGGVICFDMPGDGPRMAFLRGQEAGMHFMSTHAGFWHTILSNVARFRFLHLPSCFSTCVGVILSPLDTSSLLNSRRIRVDNV